MLTEASFRMENLNAQSRSVKQSVIQPTLLMVYRHFIVSSHVRGMFPSLYTLIISTVTDVT
jgi:hypothetical protein